MYRLMIAAVLLAAPVEGVAQGGDLQETGEQARKAWFDHSPADLIGTSPRLMIQLPGAEPSVALGPAQAAALISEYLSPTQELETSVRAAREVGPGRGYVELRRRYRVAGTQDVRVQALLLGYRLVEGRWQLVEVRVVG